MMCGDCLQVHKARQFPDNDLVHLACGHTRTPYLLPSKDGAVSLEAIISNSAAALRLFPARHQNYAVESLGVNYASENYWSRR